MREEAGIEVGALAFAAQVDIIQRDDAGAVRFHYTILDFAARWTAGDPTPGDDVTEARFFPPAALPGLGLWDEALRVIAEARLRLDG